MADRVDAVVNLSKRRGFVFPSSEIYGGTRSAWDYGPLGVELKENIRGSGSGKLVPQEEQARFVEKSRVSRAPAARWCATAA